MRVGGERCFGHVLTKSVNQMKMDGVLSLRASGRTRRRFDDAPSWLLRLNELDLGGGYNVQDELGWPAGYYGRHELTSPAGFDTRTA